MHLLRNRYGVANRSETTGNLKHLYLMCLVPAAAGFVIVRLMDGAGLLFFDASSYRRLLAPSLFILAALFSLGLPIVYRCTTIYGLKGRRQVSMPQFLRFERHLISIAMVTPYVALMALAFKVPDFHFYGIFLMALYAAYYFYPSQRRLDFEKKLFRIDEKPQSVSCLI